MRWSAFKPFSCTVITLGGYGVFTSRLLCKVLKLTSLILQDAAPHMHKGSSVVIISSLSAFQPPTTMAMYGVTKTALLGLTKV